MLLIFPFIYFLSFIISAYYVVTKRVDNIFLFIIFGLPIYITTLSVTFMYGLRAWVPVMQAFKEVLILAALGILIFSLKKKITFHLIDYLILLYFFYNLLYVFLPVGSYSLQERALAFKGISFFPFIYFTGRLLNVKNIHLSRYFHYICLVGILASVVLLFEIIPYIHIQTYTGYADYNYYYFNMDPAGNYGLTWTFEIENGLKRFASFFSTPLEHAAATLLTTSVLAALVTKDNQQIRWNTFTLIVLACTLLSITFALSRASFVSYFIILYIYIYITKRKSLLKIFHYGITGIVIVCIIWINEDLYDFIINTLNFSNSSSIYHLIEWLDGINAIARYPLGMGLGMSGRVAGALGLNVGGENQIIIIGVQTGILSILLYIVIYGYIIIISGRAFGKSAGKIRRLGLALLLLKVGLIIPLLTAETESYIYISYIAWLMTGLLISMVTGGTPVTNKVNV